MTELEAASQPSRPYSEAEQRKEKSALVEIARILVLFAALALVALGLLAGAAGIIAMSTSLRDQLTLITVTVSFMALALGLGSALAWQSWQSIQGRRSQFFHPRFIWFWGVVFVLAVGFGHAVLQSQLVPSLTFPPLHILASVLPPLMVVGLAGRGLGGVVRNRDLVFQLSCGALVATVLALSLEITVVIGVLVIVLVFVAVQPDGLDQLQALAARLNDTALLEDPDTLSSLARSPLVVLSAFIVFAIAVPLIEELVKTIGVPLRAYRRPNMPQALLWGLAGGAGFALAEGLFNSLGGMDSWAVVVSFRVGATLLHCFTGALMGLAWYYALAEKRWGRGLGLFAVSVGVHSLWNALVAGMAIASLSTQDSETTGISQTAGESGTLVAFTLLAILAFVAAVSLVGLTHFVRNREAATHQETQPVSPERDRALAEDATGK